MEPAQAAEEEKELMPGIVLRRPGLRKAATASRCKSNACLQM
jgi:hypothetical protein